MRCWEQIWIVLLTLCTASLLQTWADNHKSRDLQALYETDVNLTCADEKFHPDSAYNATFQWLLPNGRLLSTASNSSSHWTILDGGATLSVSHVDRHVFGLYLCLVSVDGLVQTSVRWSINIDGPYYGDMWAKYWPKTKVGLMAAAAVFIFLTMLCINLDQFQHFYDETERNQMRPKPQSHSADQQRSNQAYHNTIFSDTPSSNDAVIDSRENTTLSDPTHVDDTHENMQESKTSF